MNKHASRMIAGGAVAAALAAFSFVAQADDAYFSSPGQVSQDADPMYAGTIPQSPPGEPQLEQTQQGAQGPVRSDTGLSSDPSIRDTDPLTANGPWEQLPGDRVVNPVAQEQEQSRLQQLQQQQ